MNPEGIVATLLKLILEAPSGGRAWMSVVDFAFLRKCARDVLDIECQHALLKQGCYAHVPRGDGTSVSIYCSRVVDVIHL